MNGYILVGGLSRRMGMPKRALAIGGETFLDRTIRIARGAFDEAIVVDREGGALPPAVRAIVEPPHEEPSPLYGIAAALRDAVGPAWILAVDYPLITVEVLSFLRARFEQSSAPLLVPRWSGKLQMLCAGYGPSLVEVVERKLARGDLRIRGLVDEVASEIVDESLLRAQFPDEPLANVNTPEDYRDAQTHTR